MNDKVEDKKVSYSVISGELRKAAKMYEVFKNASQAADILSSFAREEELAKRKIENLENELKELDKKCDLSYEKEKESEERKITSEKEALLLLKRARVDAGQIKESASNSAEKKVEEGEKTLSIILEKTRIASKDIEVALNERGDALASLAKVEKQIQAAKDRFLKTLG